MSKVFHMLNICLSMSKYPLGSNLRGTGGLGRGLGLGFWVRVFHMLNMCLSTSLSKQVSFYVKVSFRV